MRISGQIIVNTPGTPVNLGDQLIAGPLMIKALESNTGTVAVGRDENNSVSLNSGLVLSAGEPVVFEFVGNLEIMWVDASNPGEGIAWICLAV